MNTYEVISRIIIGLILTGVGISVVLPIGTAIKQLEKRKFGEVIASSITIVGDIEEKKKVKHKEK